MAMPDAQRIKLVLTALTCDNLGDDLLSQHVERLLRDLEPVKVAATHTVEKSCTLDEFVA